MINVGVIGIGMMGSTHLDVYSKRTDVKVVAISDKIPDRLSGKEKAAGNVAGQAQGGFDHGSARQYPEGMELIADREVELVDICLPTPLHAEYAIAAMKAGKHVLSEKPVARTHAQAMQYVAAARQAKGLVMVAMCMRFWPGWDWLKETVQKQTYGPVRSAVFQRTATLPPGPFYHDAEACGGAVLDLHIHDVDFIQYLFGMPRSVYCRGYSKPTGGLDHVVTQYEYEQIPLVVAEGGWAMSSSYPFRMHYTVNFERATAVFELGGAPLMVYEEGKSAQKIQVRSGLGYEYEIDYFLKCIETRTPPKIVTLEDAAKAVQIVEAEVKSAQTGQVVPLSTPAARL